MNLLEEALGRGIVPPSQKALTRYGLTTSAWLELLALQGWKCAVCWKEHALWNTDHEHVRGWASMPPEQRSWYVRGVLCWRCNKFSVPSNMTAEQAQRVADYLEAYETRRSALTTGSGSA